MSNFIEIACRIEQQKIEHDRVSPTERWANCVYCSLDVIKLLQAADKFFFGTLHDGCARFRFAGLVVMVGESFYQDGQNLSRNYIHVTYNPEFDR